VHPLPEDSREHGIKHVVCEKPYKLHGLEEIVR